MKIEDCDFNPRPREEGDLAPNSSALLLDISIHALVKRATGFNTKHTFDITDFNPRPREEGDALVKRATNRTLQGRCPETKRATPS